MLEDEYIAGNPAAQSAAPFVVLSGCSGGGKSTLLNALSERGYLVHPEPGRQVVKEEAFVYGDALPWKDTERFIDRCIARSMYFYNTTTASKKATFFDRSFVDAIAAFLALTGHLPNHYAKILEKYRYHQTVFLVPPWEDLFATDNERQHAFSDAVVEYERLLESYPRYGYEVVVLPKTSVQARADFVERILLADSFDGV